DGPSVRLPQPRPRSRATRPRGRRGGVRGRGRLGEEAQGRPRRRGGPLRHHSPRLSAVARSSHCERADGGRRRPGAAAVRVLRARGDQRAAGHGAADPGGPQPTPRHRRHPADHVRRPHEPLEGRGRGDPVALRRQGLRHRGAPQHPAGRGAEPRPADLPVRHQVARRRGLSGAGARAPAEGGLNAKKRGLGRGLDALIEKAPHEAVRSLPVASLRPNRLQPRTHFDETAIEELAESIRAQGIVQPLVVTPEGEEWTIIAGERRWRAARRAGLEVVPVVVREVADSRELLELALVENLQRSDLNPLEEAEAYAALQEQFSLSQEAVASRVGKARTTVTNALRLLRLPEEVRELLREGQLTAGQARPLLALPGAAEQVRLAERAVRDGLSARDLERLATLPREGPKAKKKPDRPVEVHTAAAEEKL